MVVVAAAVANPAAAQTGGSLWLTWHTNTYAPPGFTGKALPTADSEIAASVEAISGGKVLDISKEMIRWYVDSTITEYGVGKKNINLRAPGVAGTKIILTVELPGRDDLLPKTAEVPVVRPEAVVDAPYPSGFFSGEKIVLQVHPFFFNVASLADLSSSWKINDSVPEGSANPDRVEINMAPGTADGFPVNVVVSLRNPLNTLESATKKTTLFYRR